MFIFQIDPAKVTGAENRKGASNEIKNPDSVLLNSLSQTSEVRPIKPPISPEMLLGKIMDLSNEYIIYAKTHQNWYRNETDKDADIDRPILLPPPWERSNELYEALAQYTKTPASLENINNVKSFFYRIMENRPVDPNHDGKLDHSDVLTIWGDYDGGKIIKGDINGDGQVNQEDVNRLRKALFIGDMDRDGKLDEKDYEKLKKIIDSPPPTIRPLERISLPWGIKGDLNHDGQLDKKDLNILKHILRAGDMDGDGKIDKADVELLINIVGNQDPLPKIKDLSKALLEDPYHHLLQIPELGKALAKYTNTEYNLGKADRLISFFLREKSDLTGDGVIDYQDVISFCKSLYRPGPIPVKEK